MRFGRFLANEKTTVGKLLDATCAGIDERRSERSLLLIQDSSEINYQAHKNRISRLGSVGNGTDKGPFIHPVLAVDAEDGACLGLAHIPLWQRTKRKTTNYRNVPIEAKESYRWIESALKARQRVPHATTLTVVADRESDIFERWDRLPDARTHRFIRACRDHVLARSDSSAKEENDTLYAWLSALPVRGTYPLTWPARVGTRTAHNALMPLRFAKIEVRKPSHCSDKQAAPSASVWAIDAVEEGSATVINQEAPIHWRLLTIHPVYTVEKARPCLPWCSQRWHIEQTFRTLKRQGLDSESSLVEDASRLEKLIVLALSAAVHTMQLTRARG